MGVLKNPLVISLGRWLEKFLYTRATHILVNSPAYKDYMIGKGVPEKKITFIPYGTDVDMFNPQVDGSSHLFEQSWDCKINSSCCMLARWDKQMTLTPSSARRNA